MKVLHSADWHLGAQLCTQSRFDEMQQFLAWLLETITTDQIDVLIIAGDLFDTPTPSNQAQSIYFSFLKALLSTSCRHVVIIAGNHDSPTFINAPKALLETLSIHVIGSAPAKGIDEAADPSSLILPLKNDQGEVELIVAAVPYLRDRDVRTLELGESLDERTTRFTHGIQDFYGRCATIAEAIASTLPQRVPIVATGHLFATAAQLSTDESNRQHIVGLLGNISADIFPETFDYVALGHLHVPQQIGMRPWIRYAGSPLALNFGEAQEKKSVVIVDFTANDRTITTKAIPTFRPLVKITGSLPEIKSALEALPLSPLQTWVQVIYTGDEPIHDLRAQIEAYATNQPFLICQIINPLATPRLFRQAGQLESLQTLSHEMVFERCLDAHQLPEEQRPALRATYHQLYDRLQQQDPRANQESRHEN